MDKIIIYMYEIFNFFHSSHNQTIYTEDEDDYKLFMLMGANTLYSSFTLKQSL